MQVFTDEFKTLMAKALAYTIVFGPIVLALLVAGGIERGVDLAVTNEEAMLKDIYEHERQKAMIEKEVQTGNQVGFDYKDLCGGHLEDFGGGSMTADEMKGRWVHQDDIEILIAIYKNEMTVAEFIEAQEEYIYELSHNLENLQEAIYDLVVLSSEARRATRNEPLLLSNIKKTDRRQAESVNEERITYMNNNTNLANLHAEYLEPPTDYFELEGFNGGEIYRGEEYLEFPNGDLVLLEKETIIEYVTDRYDKLLELLEGEAIRKVAGR